MDWRNNILALSSFVPIAILSDLTTRGSQIFQDCALFFPNGSIQCTLWVPEWCQVQDTERNEEKSPQEIH
jgi:hypothetical protein